MIRAPQVPKIARELRDSLDATVALMRRGLDDPVLAAEAEQASRALTVLHERIQFADLYLVSAEMTHAAVDAARDVPSMVIAEVEPTRTGIMIFDGGLPPVEIPTIVQSSALLGGRTAPRTVETSPEILTWTRDAELSYLALWVRVDRLPEWLRQSLPGPGRWMIAASCQTPSYLADDWGGFEHTSSVRAISLALATWTMMAIPTVADTAQRTVSGERIPGQKRRAPARAIKVIELRRLAHRPVEASEEGDGTRVYRHRWVVRGHWRQQRVGEGRSRVRTTWVPSYVKGPEGAPLMHSETVFVWRR